MQPSFHWTRMWRPRSSEDFNSRLLCHPSRVQIIISHPSGMGGCDTGFRQVRGVSSPPAIYCSNVFHPRIELGARRG